MEGQMYAIQVQLETATRDETWPEPWTASVQVPTFYLNGNVQGIVSEEHAERIARGMFADTANLVRVHATATKV